jgi:hypothetical protein
MNPKEEVKTLSDKEFLDNLDNVILAFIEGQNDLLNKQWYFFILLAVFAITACMLLLYCNQEIVFFKSACT